jgi:hypothetical protein
VGSPLLAWRPLALLVTDGGPGGDLGGPPPGGSGFGKPGPRDMGCPIGSPGKRFIEVLGTPWEEVIGVAIGLAAASGLTQLMKSLLYGIGTLDPPTYVTVPMVLLLAAGIASYVPARWAAAVDPMQALRE